MATSGPAQLGTTGKMLVNQLPAVQSSSPAIAAYSMIGTGAITGATPQVGATLLQATSNATGVVTAYATGGVGNRISMNTITGSWDNTDTVTGTNPDLTTFTFTPTNYLFDVFPDAGTTKSVPLNGVNIIFAPSFSIMLEYFDIDISMIPSNGCDWISSDGVWIVPNPGFTNHPTFFWL